MTSLNVKATVWSGITSFFQAMIVTYMTQTPQPDSWDDLVSFKFLMAAIVLFSGNAAFAHTSFRNKNARTRESDSFASESPKSIRELLDRRK